jgi:hypothetical protein
MTAAPTSSPVANMAKPLASANMALSKLKPGRPP